MNIKRSIRVFPARDEVRQLILRIAGKLGCEERYRTSGFGSGYYVELPRYVQRLLDSGELRRAERCLNECFSKGFISVAWWKAMQLREGKQEVR